MTDLLSPEEQDACSPGKKQVEEYLAEPDDTVCAKLRKELPQESFEFIAKFILYGQNIAKAQLAKTAFKENREKIACKLCAKNNGSSCTTPQPDLNSWVCKVWLYKADELIALGGGKDG